MEFIFKNFIISSDKGKSKILTDYLQLGKNCIQKHFSNHIEVTSNSLKHLLPANISPDRFYKNFGYVPMSPITSYFFHLISKVSKLSLIETKNYRKNKRLNKLYYKNLEENYSKD
ncbi:hypothetical protein BpHYR1_023893 [Brachionus plicatilis]|uniref:Uncharacterized protein n=1 Tax=Brachionus plicatilis TaxID=10195 RepID=A0A3M7RL54_BRAPC|nr:hypothetical protein BpHYR1_023893 [Brachionus plicatilis]